MGEIVSISVSFAMLGFGLLMFVWAIKLWKDGK